ncbi:PREDICTED: Holliday junction recognition protein [Elephantulus edwardii]|uniref:Holliday junction recognition protein n=1 Tax=Elephantulus edwardii TaxID=28737 RepID=UPI0003F0CE06|nr:PREDICTED: Holliday junction recognition protein [Elephantulus edwardii]
MAEASDLEAILQQRLRHSRHRFQRSMRLLIAKYDQPFEDAPLVEMTTLTYQTAQGLRVWGGRLIEEESAQHSQVEGTPLTPVSQGDSPQRAAHTDSKSDDLNATFDWKDEAAMAMALTPPVPQSPPIDELRRKYLTQVDILLQDDKRSEVASFPGLSCDRVWDWRHSQVDDRVGEDILVTLGSVSVKPTLGDDRGVCARNTWSPDNPAPSLREGDLSTAWEVVPGNDSLVSHGVSSHSFSSCQSFEARNICDVTISDLYEGMLLSMSRLLAKQPSCIISTKTVLTQDWRWRRRARGKGRLGWTYCGRNRAANWASGRRRSPPSQPDGAPHRPKDLLCGSGHGTALQLKSPLQEANTLRAHDSAPHREDLTVTPRKSSWSRHLSFIVDHDLDQEDRIMTLNWLISPVKLKSRPTTLQCLVETRHSEIEFKFDKLYQKCCPDPSTLPGPVGPWAVDVYRGDRTNPGCLRGSRRLSLPEGLGKPQKGSIRGASLPLSIPTSSSIPASQHPYLIQHPYFVQHPYFIQHPYLVQHPYFIQHPCPSQHSCLTQHPYLTQCLKHEVMTGP